MKRFFYQRHYRRDSGYTSLESTSENIFDLYMVDNERTTLALYFVPLNAAHTGLTSRKRGGRRETGGKYEKGQ